MDPPVPDTINALAKPTVTDDLAHTLGVLRRVFWGQGAAIRLM